MTFDQAHLESYESIWKKKRGNKKEEKKKKQTKNMFKHWKPLLFVSKSGFFAAFFTKVSFVQTKTTREGSESNKRCLES